MKKTKKKEPPTTRPEYKYEWQGDYYVPTKKPRSKMASLISSIKRKVRIY